MKTLSAENILCTCLSPEAKKDKKKSSCCKKYKKKGKACSSCPKF